MHNQAHCRHYVHLIANANINKCIIILSLASASTSEKPVWQRVRRYAHMHRTPATRTTVQQSRDVLAYSGMSERPPRDVRLSAAEGIKFLTSPPTPWQKQQAAPELSGMPP